MPPSIKTRLQWGWFKCTYNKTPFIVFIVDRYVIFFSYKFNPVFVLKQNHSLASRDSFFLKSDIEHIHLLLNTLSLHTHQYIKCK